MPIVDSVPFGTNANWQGSFGMAGTEGFVRTAAWAGGAEWEARLPLRAVRYTAAGLLIVAALVTGLDARGILG